MTGLPLILLGDGPLAQHLSAAASELGLPWLRSMDATDARASTLACRFALACDQNQVLAAARLNDRNCTGGLSARVVAQLEDPALGRVLLQWMLGLPALAPAEPAPPVRRVDRIGLLITVNRAQVIWRSESLDGDCFTAHAEAASRLVGLALRTDWRNAKGWGRGLLQLDAVETAQGYALRAVRCGLPPDLVAVAAAGLPLPWRDLLAALVEGARLCLTPPAPVIAVDAQGRVDLRDALAA